MISTLLAQELRFLVKSEKKIKALVTGNML